MALQTRRTVPVHRRLCKNNTGSLPLRLRPQHFHSVLLAAASCSLLGNNQRNELHSVIFTALQNKVRNTFQNVDIVLKYEGGSLFRGIIPEKYRYFSGNFRKKSAGNFRTHNPISTSTSTPKKMEN